VATTVDSSFSTVGEAVAVAHERDRPGLGERGDAEEGMTWSFAGEMSRLVLSSITAPRGKLPPG
jgi:hypothetical protein